MDIQEPIQPKKKYTAEQKREWNRRAYEKNKEERKEKMRIKAKENYENNREELLEKQKQYRERKKKEIEDLKIKVIQILNQIN